MSKFVSLYDARNDLPNLVDRAAAGEEIVIAKNGMPYAKLVPLPNRGGPRKPGDDEKITYIAGEGEAEAGGRAS
ncbi:MAG: type II toxin-antitoxin system prevent-host-death family antitoxin [Bauldia sp.]|nr:type II toxin-antitoxin system prevent-host-death family antitoxin [Bauldia sp.]